MEPSCAVCGAPWGGCTGRCCHLPTQPSWWRGSWLCLVLAFPRESSLGKQEKEADLPRVPSVSSQPRVPWDFFFLFAVTLSRSREQPVSWIRAATQTMGSTVCTPSLSPHHYPAPQGCSPSRGPPLGKLRHSLQRGRTQPPGTLPSSCPLAGTQERRMSSRGAGTSPCSGCTPDQQRRLFAAFSLHQERDQPRDPRRGTPGRASPR